MQAIERHIIEQDWITFVILNQFVLLFMMKTFNPKLLSGYVTAFFNVGFIKQRVENANTSFSIFQLFLFVFSVLNISLTSFMIFFYEKGNYVSFIWITFGIISFLAIKISLDFFIEKLLNLKNEIIYFRFSKIDYLYTCSIWMLPLLILNQFNLKSTLFITICGCVLLLIRLILIIINNKKLIFNSFLYLILYLCSLEIAPLLILYKISIQ